MPVISIKSNVFIFSKKRKSLLTKITYSVSEILSKEPGSIMASYTYCEMMLGLNFKPAVFADIENIGSLSREDRSRICHQTYEILSGYLRVDQSRIFLNFIDVNPSNAWKIKNDRAVCPDS
jgi:hypothetical protein